MIGKQDMESLTARVADLILEAGSIVVFTGAGISTESGIPDFRSPGGIWDRLDPEDFTYQKFVSDPASRRKQWQLLRRGNLVKKAEPNPAHYAIAGLERLGKLDCVITQNIDSLHQKAGVPDDKVLELHGNMQWVTCLNCGQRYPLAQIETRLEEGEEIPDCASCHGILKPDIVLFGEALPERVFEEAAFRSSNCELFITIGSTLLVYPAAYMPTYALDAGARLVIINLSSTPLDRQAAVLIRARAGETMTGVLKKVTGKRSG